MSKNVIVVYELSRKNLIFGTKLLIKKIRDFFSKIRLCHFVLILNSNYCAKFQNHPESTFRVIARLPNCNVLLTASTLVEPYIGNVS